MTSFVLMLFAAWCFGCASGIALALHADTRSKRTVGGYESSGRPASDLAPPRSGPAPGGRRPSDG